jgi:hypothetical protein
VKAEQPGRELFIATKKDHKQRAELRDAPPPRGRIPKNMSARARMDRKLGTKRGRAVYAQRSQTVEPVFGHMKDGQGAGRFSMRGLSTCRGEWHLDAAVYNLRKLHRGFVQRAANTDTGGEKKPPITPRKAKTRTARLHSAARPRRHSQHAARSELFSNSLRVCRLNRSSFQRKFRRSIASPTHPWACPAQLGQAVMSMAYVRWVGTSIQRRENRVLHDGTARIAPAVASSRWSQPLRPSGPPRLDPPDRMRGPHQRTAVKS